MRTTIKRFKTDQACRDYVESLSSGVTYIYMYPDDSGAIALLCTDPKAKAPKKVHGFNETRMLHYANDSEFARNYWIGRELNNGKYEVTRYYDGKIAYKAVGDQLVLIDDLLVGTKTLLIGASWNGTK